MLRKTLATLPKTLNQTYERILSNIDDEYAAYAQRFMKWLAYSARPLRLKELAEIVTVELAEEPRVDPQRRLPDPQDVLTICSSLVVVKQSMSVPVLRLTKPEDIANTQTAAPDSVDHEVENDFDDNTQEDGPYHFEVTLAHFSVKEYLISTDIQTAPVKDYSVIEMDASNSIAETCLAYLLQFNAEPRLTSRAICKYPLALYAAQYWPSHYKDAKEKGGLLMQLAMELLCSGAFFDCVSLYHPLYEHPRFNNHRMLDRGFRPLHYTCAHGMTDLAERVIEERVKVVGSDDPGDLKAMSNFGTALAIASCQGHLDTVRLLLKKHTDIDSWSHHRERNPPRYFYYYGIESHDDLAHHHDRVLDLSYTLSSALYNACRQGHKAIVRLLLDSNANANQPRYHHGGPPHVATMSQHERVERILLDHKVEVEVAIEFYGTALQIASSEGLENTVRLLLDRGAFVNASRGVHGNVLHAAWTGIHDSVLRLQLDRGTAVCRGDRIGYGQYMHLHPHIPRLTICEECYCEFVRPIVKKLSCSDPRHFALKISPEAKEKVGGTICSLSSPGMKQVFESACLNHDFMSLFKAVRKRDRLLRDLEEAKILYHKTPTDWGLRDDVDYLTHQWKELAKRHDEN